MELLALGVLVVYAVFAIIFLSRGGFEGAASGFRGLTFKRFVALRYLMVPHPEPRRRFIGLYVIASAIVATCMLRFGVNPFAPAPGKLAWWPAIAAELALVYAVWGLLRDRRAMLVVFVAGLALVAIAAAFAGASAHWQPDWLDERWFPIAVGASVAVGSLLAIVAQMYGVLRHSQPALITCYVGIALGAIGAALQLAVAHGVGVHRVDELPEWFVVGLAVLAIGGPVLAGIAWMFGVLRAYFTFYSTVPIGGVWIGTAALVSVLSVMTGFESDLREKILGSNAHVQVSRETGDFTEWRDVRKRIDAIPGVVASTPFAQSEVVIAADNNGMNVVIKGIDPESVGKVTKLVANIEGADAAERADAMKRLWPMVDDTHAPVVKSVAAPTGSTIDPPPPDLPIGGDPIDFSQPAPDTPDADAGSGSDSTEDPPPADLLTLDEPPIDYRDEGAVDPSIHVIEEPLEPTSRRTLSLPGILVGRELVKQTHLYTNKEVRVVSPLSDPSNPDATGTPIPFNRDYRVAGIFYSGMYEYDLKYVYVTLASLQQFLDRGDTVDGIEIRIAHPDDSDAMVERIEKLLGPAYRVQDWKDLNRSLFSALKLEKIAMFLVLGIVILVASFSIVGNLIMVVVEKAREIALLKTLGASDAGIMQVFAIQGLFIGLVGTALGVATGLAACWAGQRFNIPLNPDVYYIDKLPIVVEPVSVIITALAGVGISIAATFYPALLAARVRPAAGMRH